MVLVGGRRHNVSQEAGNAVVPTRACSRDSMTSTPAPSPMTKPSLPLSHGRDAFSGSSDRDDSALHHHYNYCLCLHAPLACCTGLQL